MNKKERITAIPFVELPDYLVRYLVCDEEQEPIALVRFLEDGTPIIQYLKCLTHEYDELVVVFAYEKRRSNFGF